MSDRMMRNSSSVKERQSLSGYVVSVEVSEGDETALTEWQFDAIPFASTDVVAYIALGDLDWNEQVCGVRSLETVKCFLTVRVAN